MKTLILSFVILAATCASAATLYLEDFTNTATGTNFNTGWNMGNADASLASLVLDGSGIRTEGWSQSNIAATAVGNNPVAGGTEMGSPFTPFDGGTSKFMYTLEVGSLGLTVADVKTFQMDLRKRDAANRVWFGILVNNKWYFTQNTLVPTLDDGVDPQDYYRYRVPADKMVEINQVWDGATGWGVERNPLNPENVVGPANLTGSESIDGFALLFTTNIAELGNMYIDNVGLTDEAMPAEYIPDVVLELSGAADLDVSFNSVVGVNYQLERSTDGMATWEFAGDPVEATSAAMTFSELGAQPLAGEKVFYRVSVAAYKIP